MNPNATRISIKGDIAVDIACILTFNCANNGIGLFIFKQNQIRHVAD